jgi:transposase
MAALKARLIEIVDQLFSQSKLAEAINYALHHWDGLTLFLRDGRVEVDSNTVERSMRPIAMGRRNSLFSGSEGGAESWAILASIVNTAPCRMRHSAVYADFRTMPNGFGKNPSFARVCG